MTHQESIWNGKYVLVVSLVSKSGKVHMPVRKYVGRTGRFVREAKNGMLLVRFEEASSNKDVSIPAGCCMKLDWSSKQTLPKSKVFPVCWGT